VPVLETMDRETLARAVGVNRRTLERWLCKGCPPASEARGGPNGTRPGARCCEAPRAEQVIPSELTVVFHTNDNVQCEQAVTQVHGD